jgi:hypothetical protein
MTHDEILQQEFNRWAERPRRGDGEAPSLITEQTLRG